MDTRDEFRTSDDEEYEDSGTEYQYHTELMDNLKCIDGRLEIQGEHLSRIPNCIYEKFDSTSITELNFNYNYLTAIPDDLCERFQSLTVLSLMGNRLIELPSNIHLLKHLQQLYVDENRITSLPLMFSRLTKLIKLHIQGNRIKSLTDDFHDLVSLKELRLSENYLESLPQEFGCLANLVELDLSYNEISSLPQSFGRLSKLKTLNLSNNKLTELPESFGQLCSIESLEMSYNSLSVLTESFSSSKCLSKLYVDNNELCSLPKWFGDMELIEEISLKANYLRDSQFPDSFGVVSQKLVKFDISGNLVSELPDSFALIKTLEFVDTGSALFEPERKKNLRNGNNIRLLPPEFGSYFNSMRELRLDENDIEELPECFGDGMPNLEVLDFYCNMIQRLPDSFCKLTKLRILSLGMNCIKKLPTDFGNLCSLEEFRIELNELRSFPLSFGKLVKLRVLDIYQNKFDVFPSILTQLPNLKSLQIGLNITDMVIKIDPKFHFAIDNLKKAIDFGVLDRNKNSWQPLGCDHNVSFNNSPHSSGYSSRTASQDKVDGHVFCGESWDIEQFDPQRPYLHEPLVYPNSHCIPSPLNGHCVKFAALFTKTPNFKIKRIKLSPVMGQFDDADTRF